MRFAQGGTFETFRLKQMDYFKRQGTFDAVNKNFSEFAEPFSRRAVVPIFMTLFNEVNYARSLIILIRLTIAYINFNNKVVLQINYLTMNLMK